MAGLIKPFWQQKRLHILLAGVACFAAFILFVHVDVVETANHAWILLRSLFSGRLLGFYEEVMAQPLPLYYVNYAHYNILVYLIFAVAELPVYIVTSLFGLGVNETLLYYIGKLVSGGFFAGCCLLVLRAAQLLQLRREDGQAAALHTLLWPPAFFAAFVMGQYDSIGLFFTLLAFCYWLQNRKLAFTLWMGVAFACKMFPLFLFLPLLLLAEKRPLHVLKYGLLSLWVLAPTTLLYAGRGGDMAGFNSLMADRLLEGNLRLWADIPLFLALYACLCFAAFLWRPGDDAKNRHGLWLCLAVFALLFLFVEWHPQWLVFLAPFVVLTTFAQQNRLPWFLADIALSAAFFVRCFMAFPGQLEANLVYFGLPGLLGGAGGTAQNVSFYINALLPQLPALLYAVFTAVLLAQLVLKFSTAGGSLAARLGGGTTTPAANHAAAWLWATFGCGMAVWLLPTLFTWAKVL